MATCIILVSSWRPSHSDGEGQGIGAVRAWNVKGVWGGHVSEGVSVCMCVNGCVSGRVSECLYVYVCVSRCVNGCEMGV